MRPIELTLEGFRSYYDRATFSFENRGVFGIVGPTGAGKSSILDAMVYALFGKTPRLERGSTRLINSRSEAARTQLSFEVEGRRWEATRVIKSKGGSEVSLKDDSGEVRATGAHATNEKITDLIGLDFKAFCSSVVLPQGEFDRFLTASSGQQTEILKRVFRLDVVDKMRDLAKEKGQKLAFEIEGLERQLSGLPENPERELADLLEKQKLTKDRVNLLTKGSQEASVVELRKEQLENTRVELEKRLEEARSIADAIPDASDLEQLVLREEQARKTAQGAEKELEKVQSAQVKAAAADRKAAEDLTSPDALRAQSLLAEVQRNETEAARSKIETKELDANVKGFVESQSIHQRKLEAAREDLAKKVQKVNELYAAHRAHLLRRELKKGDACPVCEQEVGRVPKSGAAPKVEAAEKAKERAEASLIGAQRLLGEEERRLFAAQGRREEAGVALEKLETELTQAKKDLEGIFGKGKDAQAELAKLSAAAEKAATELKAVAAQLNKAESALKEATEALGELRDERGEFAGALIQACTKLSIDPPSVNADAPALLGSSKTASESAELMIEKVNRERLQLEDQGKEVSGKLLELAKKYEINAGVTFAQALGEANTQLGGLKEKVANTEEAIRRQKEANVEIKAAKDRHAVYEQLKGDFSNAKFIAYLLDSEKLLLSQLGSQKLEELTGRYRFDDEGDFQIIDLPIGQARSPDTLSGGETFLASLALALALAESVAQGGSRLECFFLDEGFGGLDREMLEQALDGIEALATTGRMIGLISHVPAIQSRLDDLIVLDKGQDGATIVSQTEGPIGFQAVDI